MGDQSNNSLVHIDGKAAEALVKETGRGLAGFFRPRQIVKIAEAEAKAKIIHAETDIKVRELQLRAEYCLRAEAIVEQQNLEAIAARAIPLLADGTTTENVDDDWMTNLRNKARLISNEQMQTLWARVLAGEVNKPGSFSRRTVNYIADLDREDCELFTSLCSFGWHFESKNIPLIFDSIQDPIYTNNRVNYSFVQHLDDIGLISLSSPGIFQAFDYNGPVEVGYFGDRFIYELPSEANNKIDVGRVVLTTVGAELAPICGAKPIPGFLNHMLSRWCQILRPTSIT